MSSSGRNVGASSLRTRKQGKITPVTRFGTGSGWPTSAAGYAAININDATKKFAGAAAATLVTDGTSNGYAPFRRDTFPAVSVVGSHFQLKFSVTGYANLKDITFYAASAGGLASSNYLSWDFWNLANQQNKASLIQPGDVVTMTLAIKDAFTVGAPNLAAITDYQFTIQDTGAGQQATISLGSIDVVADNTPAKWANTGLVVITMDDSYANQVALAMPEMRARGLRGTLFPILEGIDTSGFLTSQDLRDAQDRDGWEVGTHASTFAVHSNFYNMTPAQAATDAVLVKSALAARGLTGGDTYAYPLGAFNGGTDAGLAGIVNCARTVNGVNNETWPPANLLRLRSSSGIGGLGGIGANTFTDVNGALDHIQSGKGVQILTFHDFTAGASTGINVCTLSAFTQILDGIVSRGIATAPLGEYIAATAGL